MINALPSALRAHVNEIASIINGWPAPVTIEHAIRWVLQFDKDDYHIAIRTLRHLQVVGAKDIKTSLETAHTKLLRRAASKGAAIDRTNTVYAAIGNTAKSGGLIAYYYRMAVELSEDDFLSSEDDDKEIDLSNIKNIVLVDDIIGTGTTVANEIEQVASNVYGLPGTKNIYALTVAGYEQGIEKAASSSGATVVCALEYSTLDTVASTDGAFFDGLSVSERESTLASIKRYCRAVSSSELGYGNIGGLLVLDHNTPNTTLPIVWSNGKGWLPLFPRAQKINGAAKIFKKPTHSSNTNQPITQASQRASANITLFVEGKIDELFIDHLAATEGLASRLGVGSVSSIALGGLYQSERLINALKESNKLAIFILDDDDNSRKAATRIDALSSASILYLKPNFISLLDAGKIFSNAGRFRDLPEFPEGTAGQNDPAWLRQIELAVLRRGPISSNTGRILELISEFIDPKKVEEFIALLKKRVDDLFNNTT